VATQNVVKLKIQLNLVFLQVFEQFFGAQNLAYFVQLVKVVLALEHGVLGEQLKLSLRKD